MNFYDVLAAEKWGGGIPTINFFDLLFAQSMGGGEQWQTYEGTLPATLNANGDDMRQYQVYGAAGGVGEPTENLFDISTATFGKYINDTGVEAGSTASDSLYKLNHSDFININPETDYVFAYKGSRLNADQRISFCWYTDSKVFLYRDTYLTEPPITEYQFSKASPSNAKYLIINFYGYNNNAIYMLTPGTTTPEAYVPYGYEVDISTSDGTTSTTTSIYIGDTTLEKDEYIDYQVGKVLRKTVNLLNFEDVEDNMNLNMTTGLPTAYPGRAATETPIDVSSYDAVTISFEGAQGIENLRAILSTFTANDELISRVTNIESGRVVNISNVAYMYVCIYQANLQNIYKSDILNAMLTPGTIPPETYIPYLQPTDPPVPLPALPTVKGTTIVDYAGSGTAPEKVYFEYKGGTQS